MHDRRLRALRLSAEDRGRALDLLLSAPEDNLVLIDQVERLAESLPGGELPPQIHGTFDGERLTAVAALRPGIALSHGIDERALAALRPALSRIPTGLLKSERATVAKLWPELARVGREALIDRIELAYRLNSRSFVSPRPGSGAGLPTASSTTATARPARIGDLASLVYAARASLWEEQRPDPAVRDPVGFARWVESRIGHARVVCEGERVVFVAYADVRRRQGWLVQGVYTWPDVRRRGHARLGMTALLAEAFAAGAAHVQLAVVSGNERASRLYRQLGFEPFAELRTILFH